MSLPQDDPVINAQTNQPIIWTICGVFSFVSVLVVGLRLYTRHFILHRLGSEDVTIVLAEVLALLTALGAAMEAHYGLGRHRWTFGSDEFLMQQRWLYMVIIVYNLGTNMIKLSILLQYRKLFPAKWMVRLCNWSMAFICLWAVAQVSLLATTCLPVATIIPSMVGHCLDSTPIWLFTSAMNIVTDVYVFILPLPELIKLKIARKQKIMLVLIFCIGFFTCIISMVRITTITSRTQSNDQSFGGIYPAIWSIVELHSAILCSSLATLRPLLKKFIPGLAGPDSSAQYEMKSGGGPSGLRRTGGGGGGPSAYALESRAHHGAGKSSVSRAAARPISSDSSEGLKETASADFPLRRDGGPVATAYTTRHGASGHASDSDSDVGHAHAPAGVTPVDTGAGPLRVHVRQEFEAKESWLADPDDRRVNSRTRRVEAGTAM